MTTESATTSTRDQIGRALALAAIGVAVVAVVSELRRTGEDRTWQGRVMGVPYDFRAPTTQRLRSALWNPDGPLMSAKVTGVGWVPNVGRLARGVRRSPSA
jgi:hypothetical protein